MRAAKFVARKQWVVCGADDFFVRVYNYNTMDKVKAFEAHTDYIRWVRRARDSIVGGRCTEQMGGLMLGHTGGETVG